MSMSKVHCEKVLERAHLMGMDAGRSVGVNPMVVGTPTELMGNEIDYSKKTYVVEGGVCGFAGVVIKPARGKFVSYLKSIGMGNKFIKPKLIEIWAIMLKNGTIPYSAT